jgi:TonB-dependent outer membrane receptor, SusC/RagA subfamily, signature region
MNKFKILSKDSALLFMKPLLLGFILGLSFTSIPSTLQAASKTIVEINQEGNITLVVKKKSLRSVLSDIEKHSQYVFGYNSQLPYMDHIVSVSLKKATIQQTMDAVLKGLPLTYELSGRQVLLVEKNGEKQVEKVVSGRVVDENNEPLIGVNVQSGSAGTITDIDGKFTLKAKGTVTFSYIGYNKQYLKVDNCKEVRMKPLQETLDEVVVTALGMKRSEKALGYSTQKVSGDLFEKVKGTNVATSLTGRISGLTVFNTTEFNEAPTLSLRGETPLLVLDGVPTNLTLSDINQDDIETIDVLKGATASALYGSRGGSGVIMVTTKKGAEKKGFTVTVNGSNMINAGTLALPKVQSSYSSGYGGKYNVDDEVWGDKLDIGRTALQYDPKTYQVVEKPLVSAGKNNFKNFTEFSYDQQYKCQCYSAG